MDRTDELRVGYVASVLSLPGVGELVVVMEIMPSGAEVPTLTGNELGARVGELVSFDLLQITERLLDEPADEATRLPPPPEGWRGGVSTRGRASRGGRRALSRR